MITRGEILNEVSRLHDSFYTDVVRKEAITDYILRLLGDTCPCRDCSWVDSCTLLPFTDGCKEKWGDLGGHEQHSDS